jgi:hypothetical protein
MFCFTMAPGSAIWGRRVNFLSLLIFILFHMWSEHWRITSQQPHRF